MAEFCKECFKNQIAVSSDKITDNMLELSDILDLCEGCGAYKPIVIQIKELNE